MLRRRAPAWRPASLRRRPCPRPARARTAGSRSCAARARVPASTAARRAIWTMEPRRQRSAAADDAGGQHRTPAWSPDGTRIAFASDRDGDFDIWIMNADGSDQRQRHQRPGRPVRSRLLARRPADRVRRHAAPAARHERQRAVAGQRRRLRRAPAHGGRPVGRRPELVAGRRHARRRAVGLVHPGRPAAASRARRRGERDRPARCPAMSGSAPRTPTGLPTAAASRSGTSASSARSIATEATSRP